MNLAIDVGNTRVKVALFKDGSIFYDAIFSKDSFVEEICKISKKYSIQNAIISSVASISKEEIKEIGQLFSLVSLNAETNLPFDNQYQSKETLGVDRIALVAAAKTKYPDENVLIIDAGTCITYDFINEYGIYSGGAIAPGIEMRYKSLHTFTDNLPLLKVKLPEKLIGNSTKNSIHSGVVNGVLAEINGIIQQYEEKNKKLTVVLTGGNTNFLAKRLKNGIFANPKFLLEGLNSILTYNFEND